ncbi:hypothetical protein G6F57_021236 [Rhizopus arrhizus]|nr:hypothetical protein G6F57_021236 [Rhizopus arrhizus]
MADALIMAMTLTVMPPMMPAHRARRLHQPVIHIIQTDLRDPRKERHQVGRQRHDGRPGSQRGAHQEARERQHGHQQDDEGDGAERVHRDRQHLVQARLGVQVAGRGHRQHHGQRQARHDRDDGGDAHHRQGLQERLQRGTRGLFL